MRDLARAFKCKPANIYNYFANKEYILFEILLDQMQKIVFPIRHLEDDNQTNPVDQLRFLITSHLAATLEYEMSYKLLYDVGIDNLSPSRRKKIVSLRDEYERILRKIIRRGIESGHFKETDEKLAVYCIASMIARTMLWYSPEGRLRKDEINFSLKALKGDVEDKIKSNNNSEERI